MIAVLEAKSVSLLYRLEAHLSVQNSGMLSISEKGNVLFALTSNSLRVFP
jgi:hypothetical protein